MSEIQYYDWDKKNSTTNGELVIFGGGLGGLEVTNEIHTIVGGVPFSRIESLSLEHKRAVLSSLGLLGENVKPTIQRWHVGGGQSQ